VCGFWHAGRIRRRIDTLNGIVGDCKYGVKYGTVDILISGPLRGAGKHGRCIRPSTSPSVTELVLSKTMALFPICVVLAR